MFKMSLKIQLYFMVCFCVLFGLSEERKFLIDSETQPKCEIKLDANRESREYSVQILK